MTQTVLVSGLVGFIESQLTDRFPADERRGDIDSSEENCLRAGKEASRGSARRAPASSPRSMFVGDCVAAVFTLGSPGRCSTTVQGEQRVLRCTGGVRDEARHACTGSRDTLTIETARNLAEAHEDHDMPFLLPLGADFASEAESLVRPALLAHFEVEQPRTVQGWCAIQWARQTGTTPAGA